MALPLQQTYDFVIVGAGPAGCIIASKLAAAPAHPTVLLIEAGGDNADSDGRIDGNRYGLQMNPMKNWEDKTVPQSHLQNQVLDIKRGKGLGGGSAINFSAWSIGPKDDYG